MLCLAVSLIYKHALQEEIDKLTAECESEDSESLEGATARYSRLVGIDQLVGLQCTLKNKERQIRDIHSRLEDVVACILPNTALEAEGNVERLSVATGLDVTALREEDIHDNHGTQSEDVCDLAYTLEDSDIDDT